MTLPDGREESIMKRTTLARCRLDQYDKQWRVADVAFNQPHGAWAVLFEAGVYSRMQQVLSDEIAGQHASQRSIAVNLFGCAYGHRRAAHAVLQATHVPTHCASCCTVFI